MSQVRLPRMIRPIGVIIAAALLMVAAALYLEARPRGAGRAAPTGAPESPTTATTGTTMQNPTASTAVTTTVVFDSSPTTEAEPPVITDFGPPVTVGDYTLFCPALDELAELDRTRAEVADRGSDVVEQWRLDRQRVVAEIDRTLNYRSPQADEAMATLVATADDTPLGGPLSADAEQARDFLVEFAAYSCEVNRSLPPTTAPPVDNDQTTTTGP